jgi:hypothetical protein
MLVVVPEPDSILFDDARLRRQTNGHLITFDWHIGQMGFVAQISLFNTVTYQVRICPEYRGLWHTDFCRGHHFNVDERTIEQVNAFVSAKQPSMAAS